MPDQPHQLSLLESTLSIPGGRITRRNLEIDAATPSDLLPAIGHRILAVRGYSKWALGAVLCEMRGRDAGAGGAHDMGGTSAGTGTSGGNEDGGGRWAGHWSDAAGIDPKERREIMGVYTFYPPNRRGAELSWEHYREAMFGVMDGAPRGLNRALAYLAHAEAAGLTVSALRRHIRSQVATESPEPTTGELAGYGAVFDFRRYAARELERIDSYTAERAALVLADIGEETARFIDELRRIAALANDGRKSKGNG